MHSKLDNISVQVEDVLSNQRNLQEQLDKQSNFFEKISGRTLEEVASNINLEDRNRNSKSLLFMSELEINGLFKDFIKVFKQVEDINKELSTTL